MSQESKEFLIDSYRADLIEDIAKDNNTLFSNFDDFVNESIGTFILWWSDPAKCQNHFRSLLPHLKPEMIAYMKKKMNEKEFSAFTKDLEEQRAQLTELEYIPSEPGIKRFHLDMIRCNKIESIIRTENVIKKIKNVNDFFDDALDLFITWWTDPENTEHMMFEMWPYMPSKVISHWKNDPELKLTFEQMDKEAKEWNEKHGKHVKPIIDNNSIPSEISESTEEFSAPFEKESIRSITDVGSKQFHKMCTKMQNTRDVIGKFLAPEPRTGDALPDDDFPLVWEFYSRLLPIKLVVAVLADMIVEKGKPLVDYKEFRERAYFTALGLSDRFSDYEKKFGTKRNKKRSTGFPISSIQLMGKSGIEKDKKFTASKDRFQEHFIGMKKEAWVRRQYETDSAKIRLNKRNGLAYFDGALNSMGLIHVHAEMNGRKPDDIDQSKKVSPKFWEMKIGLTKRGVDFFLLESPILKGFQETWTRDIFSKEESDFILQKIIPDFPLENEFIQKSIEFISSKKEATGKELESIFDRLAHDWWQENKDTNFTLRLNMINKRSFSESCRARTMARLAELNKIEWNMEAKTGKPLYSLKKETDLISQ